MHDPIRETPQYKRFRNAVVKRDRGKCQFPNCESKRRVYVHHIMRVADCPSLIHEVSNGICLCKKHHQLCTGDEPAYAELFMNIVAKKSQSIPSQLRLIAMKFKKI